MIIHYFPEARPALILAYIPAIIYSATQSLSFGIITISTVAICFSALLILENFALFPYQNSPVYIANLSSAVKAGIFVSFLFLLILGFLANYFMEILRKREKRIKELADLNKKLYQRSKTTSDEILKNMGEGLVVVDKDFKIVKYNNTFKSMTEGISDLTNLDIGQLPLVFSSRLKAYLQHLVKDEVKSFSFKAQDKLKHIFNISITMIDLKEREKGFLIILNQKSLPWGTVFDSITKAPIDLAVVRLHRVKDGEKIVETKVTDNTGRFGFIVPQGDYYITVSKDDYNFPSKSKTEGYRGEKFVISSPEEAYIQLSIPLDKK